MQLNILYLDDEADLCENFSDEYSSPEIHVVTFTNPKQAIEVSHQRHFDIIFLDYRLPETNGDLVAQAMPAHIPKYLLTGEVSVDTQYPFNGIFGKPVDWDGIRALLETLSKKSQVA